MSRPEVFTSVCTLEFSSTDVGVSQTFHVYPHINYQVTDPQNVSITLVADMYDNGVMATSSYLATVTVEVIDRDTAGFCTLIMDPHITTFDNL